jgi:hypothetical protein
MLTFKRNRNQSPAGISRSTRRLAGLLVALTVLASWQTVRAAPLEKKTLSISAATPIIVPFEKNRGIGVGLGFLESVKLTLTDHVQVELTGGIIYYPDIRDRSEQDYLVMGGVSYLFGSPQDTARTYLSAHLGYTYARRGDDINHRMTGAVGFGLDIRLSSIFHLDLGGDLIVTNLFGRFEETSGVLIKAGGTFDLF